MRGVTTLYLFLKGSTSLFVATVYAIELIYQIRTVGLNPFELVLAGTVNQAILMLFQAPTGALADMYSRRWAVVIGLCVIGAGFLLEGGVSTLAAVFMAQALWGLGASLVDGADAAWIADELGAESAGPIYLRATQIGWLCTLPGIALGAGLGSVRLNIPILVGGFGYLTIGFILAAIMPERQFAPAAWENQTSSRRMRHTIQAGFQLIRFQSALLAIVGIGALSGISSEGFGRLWQYHLLHSFTFPFLGKLAPVVWFGIIETVIALTNVAGIEIARRRVTTTNHRSVAWALCITDGSTIAGIMLFALAGQFALALVALWLITTVNGPHIPLRKAWINQYVGASVRATVFSLDGQVSALAAILGGPLIGAVATKFTTRPALIAAGIILAPALLLYARTLRRDRPLVVASVMEEERTTAMP
jgi:MFS transporter, DHA3 family, tetracycline resistance protein